ncbi:hypothetical protein [Paraclostridium sordellii]|nr:hypothetical protein [Paeniclostridium sordellii]QYE99316.1 hypothetical protein KZ987_07375 [Paeniclostridium sordellii]
MAKCILTERIKLEKLSDSNETNENRLMKKFGKDTINVGVAIKEYLEKNI